jgi:hypothetical protein
MCTNLWCTKCALRHVISLQWCAGCKIGGGGIECHELALNPLRDRAIPEGDNSSFRIEFFLSSSNHMIHRKHVTVLFWPVLFWARYGILFQGFFSSSLQSNIHFFLLLFLNLSAWAPLKRHYLSKCASGASKLTSVVLVYIVQMLD